MKQLRVMFHQIDAHQNRKLDFRDLQHMNEPGKLSPARKMENERITFEKMSQFPDGVRKIRKVQLVRRHLRITL